MIRKIDVLGPSASGKSHLARDLSRQFDIPMISVDALTRTSMSHSRTPEKEVLDEIGRLTMTREWILEGKYLAKDVFDRADLIVWVHRGLASCLFAQWIRYFTDADQRARYDILSNARLTVRVVRQHLGVYADEDLLKPRVYTYRKAEQLLSKWPAKVCCVRNARDGHNLMERIRDSRG